MKFKYTLMLIPISVFYVFLFVLPQVAFLRASLYENARFGRLGEGPTFDNYVEVLTDSFYLRSFLKTLQLSLITAVVGLLIAYPMAYTIARSRHLWSRVLFITVVASMFVSAIVRALGWKVLLARSGPINDVFEILGVGSVRMSDNFLAVAIGTVHAEIPLLVIGLVPICEAVPRDLLDAARGLGSTRFRTFWQVIFPLTRTGIVGVGLLVFAVTAGVFTTPALLGGGRVGVVSVLIRQQTLQVLNYPLGATLAAILMLGISVTVGATLLLTRRSHAVTIRGG